MRLITARIQIPQSTKSRFMGAPSGFSMMHAVFLAPETIVSGPCVQFAPGLRSELQTGIARRGEGPEGQPVSAYVENIIARVPGTANTRSVLLLAHYESVSSGPGAADDASGVGVLLEMARLVQTSPRLRNELVFLFTDGEEVGLLGATLFAQRHPLAKGVGVALNFDSGANGGPVSMYQATEHDEWLVGRLRKALPGAAAQSFI